MKSRTLTCITAMTLFAALALPVQFAAQDVTGSGTINYVPRWTGSTTLGNSKIFQSGGMVGIGTTSPIATVDVIGQNATAGPAPTAFRVIGGGGGIAGTGGLGTGGGILLISGPGGKSICFPLFCTAAGTGGSVAISGGLGGGGGKFGGSGGNILLQPGAGGSGFVVNGSPGNVLLAPSSGNVGIGTTSPTAKLYVHGNFIATGSKSALVQTASYGKRQLYAMESPENWFEDFGGAQLIHGRATVKLDPIFAETVSTEDGYYVFLTPKGDCEGLYVASQSTSSFEVRELRRGKGAIAFDYRVVAKRKGYERARLAELKDGETLTAGR